MIRRRIDHNVNIKLIVFTLSEMLRTCIESSSEEGQIDNNGMYVLSGNDMGFSLLSTVTTLFMNFLLDTHVIVHMAIIVLFRYFTNILVYLYFKLLLRRLILFSN